MRRLEALRARTLAAGVGLLVAGLLAVPAWAGAPVRAQTPPPAGGTPGPVVRDGQLIRDSQGRLWLIDGGQRHLVELAEVPAPVLQGLPEGEPARAGLQLRAAEAGEGSNPPSTLAGSSSSGELTQEFWLNPGLVTLHAHYAGKGLESFKVILGRPEKYDDTYKLLMDSPVVFDYVGEVADARAVANVRTNDGGPHVLQVWGSSSWRVEVDQPVLANVASLPQTFTGRDQSLVTPFFKAQTGTLKLAVRMQGEGLQIGQVLLVDQAGATVDLLVNQAPPFELNVERQVTEGVYALRVVSGFLPGATWTIEVSQ